MNRPFLSLLAFGVCMMLPELYVRSAVPSDVAVEFGTLKDGQTYAGSVYEGKPPEKRMGNVNLLGAEIRENAKVSKYNLPLVVSRDFSKNTLRWRMAHGYYWCVEIHGSGPSQQSIELSRIGLADIDAFITGAAISIPQSADGQKKLSQKRDKDKTKNPVAREMCGRIRPLEDAWKKFKIGEGERTGSAYYDFLPISADACVFYILSGRSMTVWQYQFKLITDQQGKWPQGKWSQQDAFQVDWTEPFYVYAKDSVLFFVTESGKLYRATASQAGSRKVEELWARPQQPILALLLDANNSQAFAFGKDFFFEIRDVVRPSPCEDVAGRPPSVQEPIQTVIRCAVVLRKWRKSVNDALPRK